MDYDNQLEDINWQKYWLILKRGRKITLTVFALVTSLGFLYAFLSKPLYRSQAKLLIKTNITSSLTGLGENMGRIEPLTDESDPLNAQAEILLSNTALKQTIKELQLKDESGQLIPIKKLASGIDVDAVKGTDVLKVNYTAAEPQMAATVVEKLVEIFIEQNIRDNRAVAGAAREFILEQLPKTEKNVEQAEFALRKFKEENNITYLGEESSASIHVIKDLEEKINDFQGELVDVTARWNNLKQQTNLEPDEAARLVHLSQVPGIQAMLSEVQSAENQLAAEQTRFHPQNPTVINLKEKVAELKKSLQQKIEQETGSKQQINWSNLQVGDLQASLVRELAQTEKERIGLEQRLVKMNNTLSSYKQQAKAWPKLEQSLKELERKVKASQTTYETLLTRLQEINVAENQNIGNIRVISQPLVPEEPFNSRKRMIVMASGVLGILLGVGVTLVVDMTDKSLKTVEEAKQLFPYNLLTTIPNLDGNSNSLEMMGSDFSLPRLIYSDMNDYRISDAYQLLQANLSFCAEKEPKTITITSSVPNEGKSRICANLAVAMAQGERRVLLIDANMRNPTQHEIWELPNSMGLINLFLNQVPVNNDQVSVANMMVNKVSTNDVIHNVMPNLDLLPSGGTISNTLALLESTTMSALVEKFKREYDMVIFDAPALKGKADAGLLGKLSDGVVFVIRTGVADIESVNEAQEFLENSRQTVLGMVVNEAHVNHQDSKIKAIAGSQQRYLQGHS